MPFNLQKAIISSLKFPDSILIRFTTNKLFPSNKIARILNAFFNHKEHSCFDKRPNSEKFRPRLQYAPLFW